MPPNKISDFLSSDAAQLIIPALAAVGAVRAPRTTQGAIAGLNVFSTLAENKRLQQERARKREKERKLSEFVTGRANALLEPTEDFVPQIETEPGDEPVGLRRVEQPATESNRKLSDVFRAAVAGGRPEAALKIMGTLATREPKEVKSPFAKIDAKDFTPESLKAFRTTITPKNRQGDQSVLVPREKIDKAAASPFTKISPKDYKPESIRAFRATITPDTPQGDVGVLVPRETAEQAGAKLTDKDRLLKQFATESKPFVTIRDSYKRVQAAAKEPSAFGDIALVFNFMKILDPGSVVRESEFATASNAGGVPERTRALYNRVLSGERLSEDMRTDLVGTSGRLFQSQVGLQTDREKQFGTFATQRGFKPEEVVQDYLGSYRKVGQKTQVGTTKEGKRIFRMQDGSLKVEE